jgi:signal transduction histidine kinase
MPQETKNLKTEKGKFDAVFYGNQSPLVIFHGPEFIYERFNQKYHEIYGERELIGRKLIDAVPELRGTIFPEILTGVYKTGNHYVGRESHARIKNMTTGEFEDRYFDTTFSRIDYGEGEEYRILASPSEVTERVVARKKLEESLVELQLERDMRERFVSALSHDLRTPFAVAKISAQLLKRKAENKEAVFETSDKIISNMDRADRMIRDLLDANRIKSGEGLNLNYQEVILNLSVEYVVSELEDLYGKKFVIVNKSGDVKGQWDISAIQRIMENLSSNAIKYGDKNKKVTITIEKMGEWAQISVHNFGEIISKEDQSNLFVQYHRTASAMESGQRGWGIGLSLVKGLTEAHGGSVAVSSEAQSGTTFFVKLPLVRKKV